MRKTKWSISLLIPLLSASALAGEKERLLIQLDGDAATVIDEIQALGGRVTQQYVNVSALAVTVPAGQLDKVGSISGVSSIEKDQFISLPEPEQYSRPMAHDVAGTETIDAVPLATAAIDVDSLPQGYANFAYTGAIGVWEETHFGAGSVVAVVDTGTVPNTCIGHAIVGAPGFPDGYNAVGDGIPATDPTNHSHGTYVGGVIASACSLDFSENPDHPLYQAIAAHTPWDSHFVPIFGQAPGAQLYPVKVFGYGSSPVSVILDGLDHVLTLKRSGLLDVDIVNMSLGGPTSFDGLNTFDLFVLELWKEQVVVVTSAGNAGPTPNTIGSPATAYNAISVGALDYPTSSRVLYEYLGLVFLDGPGQGFVMRPDNDVKVVNFSSRGPMSDGRAGPEISALGMWNFQMTTTGGLGWSAGTSFASPAVAGAAALLNSYIENVWGKETSTMAIRGSLQGGANDELVGAAWRGIADQGRGVLDVPAALRVLKNHAWSWWPFEWVGPLQPNILPPPSPGKVDTFEKPDIKLAGSESVDFNLEIGKHTSRVIVEITNMYAEDNGGYAFWPNAIQLDIQSAKRSARGRPVAWIWYPQYWGNSVTYVIEDGLWLEESDAWGSFPTAYQPMEPGIMKITFAGDYSNETPVYLDVRVTRENRRMPLGLPVAEGWIQQDESVFVATEIQEGVSQSTIDLTWMRDWRHFPTSDLDFLVWGPNGGLFGHGTTLNAPERAIVANPIAGTYVIEVIGQEVYMPDYYRVYVSNE
jgi:hypothetical protein